MTVCSTEFLALGRAQARALNYPDLPIVTVPHPFGSLARGEIRTLAADCVDQIVAALSGRPD